MFHRSSTVSGLHNFVHHALAVTPGPLPISPAPMEVPVLWDSPPEDRGALMEPILTHPLQGVASVRCLHSQLGLFHVPIDPVRQRESLLCGQQQHCIEWYHPGLWLNSLFLTYSKGDTSLPLC